MGAPHEQQHAQTQGAELVDGEQDGSGASAHDAELDTTGIHYEGGQCGLALAVGVAHEHDTVGRAQQGPGRGAQIPCRRAGPGAPGQESIEHEQRAGQGLRSGLQEAIDDDHRAVPCGGIDGRLAGWRDPGGDCPRGQGASGDQGVIADQRYGVVDEYLARVERASAVGVGDEGDAGSSAGEGLSGCDCDGGFAGAAEDSSADADDGDRGEAEGAGDTTCGDGVPGARQREGHRGGKAPALQQIRQVVSQGQRREHRCVGRVRSGPYRRLSDASRRSFQGMRIASKKIRRLILEWPTRRSTKTMGISMTLSPRRRARKVVSIWNA